MSKSDVDPGHIAVAEAHRLAAEASFPETIGEFVESRANDLGDKVLAVFFEEGDQLTYRELDESSRKLADGLLQRGIRKGTHVGVMLPNVKEFAISWVALGRIGAIMVPINVSYTSSELHFILTDSDAQFVIVDNAYLDRLEAMDDWPPLIRKERVIVRGVAPEGYQIFQDVADEGSSDFVAPSRVTATDLLNLQYTSGTTGFPKGCMLSHEYWILLSHLAAMQRIEKLNIQTALIWAPFFYMDAQYQFLMTLKVGGTAYVARRMSLTRFMDWLIEFSIEYCAFPEPALGRIPVSDRDRETSLKFVNAFGWRGDANAEVERRFNLVARNSFGMTEIGGGIALPPEAVHMVDSESCGLPMPFREVRIVGEDGNDVTQGDTGELWVAGRAILSGYYKRPDANAGSFRGRWFRTGDIFRQDENGYYYIVGRFKDMIRRAGENISAREIEATLRRMDEIEEAAALPVPDELRREEVKIFLMLSEGLTKDDCPLDSVIAHCQQHLAGFKVPRYYEYVKDFPRTPTRKIAKNKMMGGDLRIGSYDRIDDVWR